MPSGYFRKQNINADWNGVHQEWTHSTLIQPYSNMSFCLCRKLKYVHFLVSLPQVNFFVVYDASTYNHARLWIRTKSHKERDRTFGVSLTGSCHSTGNGLQSRQLPCSLVLDCSLGRCSLATHMALLVIYPSSYIPFIECR